MKMRRLCAFLAGVMLSMPAVSACSDAPSGSDGTSGAEDETASLTVFAASSLNNAFLHIAQEVYTEEYPNVEVKFSFEGSSALAEQINAGANADVFASADENNMAKVEGHAVNPQEFTHNTLRLIVPKNNPAGIEGIEDLAGTKLVVCAPQVPCGRVTSELATSLNVTFAPVSQEQKVTDVRAKVESGEADAGFVYMTDARVAEADTDIVEVDGIEDVRTSYMISTIDGSENIELAHAFIEAVNSDEGQAILAEYGFGTGGQ